MAVSQNMEPWIQAALDLTAGKVGSCLTLKSFTPAGGSSLNSTGKLTTNKGDFFIKWSQGNASEMYTSEAAGLQKLVNSGTSLQIPTPICTGQAGSIYFLVTEFLEFTSPDTHYQEALGRGLAELHQFSNHNFGFETDNFCGLTPQYNNWVPDWAEFYTKNRLDYIYKLIKQQRPVGGLSASKFSTALKKIKPIISTSDKPSLIHGDLWSGNASNTSKGPSIFDPAAYFGHPEAELGMMFLFGGFSQTTISAYQEVVPLNTGWRQRLDIYKLYHVLNHYLLFGGGYLSQAESILQKYW